MHVLQPPTSYDDQPVSVRLPNDLVSRLKQKAEANDRTLSAEIRRALRAHADDAQAQAA